MACKTFQYGPEKKITIVARPWSCQKSKIIKVVCHIQRFYFECNMLLIRKVIMGISPALQFESPCIHTYFQKVRVRVCVHTHAAAWLSCCSTAQCVWQYPRAPSTSIKAVLSDDEGMGQKTYRNPVCIMQDTRGEITRKCVLFRTEFTVQLYALYALLQSDRSKMRLVPEAAFSENDFI